MLWESVFLCESLGVRNAQLLGRGWSLVFGASQMFSNAKILLCVFVPESCIHLCRGSVLGCSK